MTDMSPIAVAIDASHPAIRAALVALVRSEPHFALVPRTDDGGPHADVLVLAHPNALAHGGAMIRAARQHAPRTAVVVAAAASGPAYDAAARAAGAAAHVELDTALLGALRAAAGRPAERHALC
jgi:hypothetical protein